MDQLCFSLVDVCVHVFPANSFAKHQIMTFKSAKLHPTQRTRFPKKKTTSRNCVFFPFWLCVLGDRWRTGDGGMGLKPLCAALK